MRANLVHATATARVYFEDVAVLAAQSSRSGSHGVHFLADPRINVQTALPLAVVAMPRAVMLDVLHRRAAVLVPYVPVVGAPGRIDVVYVGADVSVHAIGADLDGELAQDIEQFVVQGPTAQPRPAKPTAKTRRRTSLRARGRRQPMDEIGDLKATVALLRSGLRRADWQRGVAVHSARIGGLLRAAASAVGGYHGRERTAAGWTLFAQTAVVIVPVLRITRRGRSRTVHDLDELVVAVEVIVPELVDANKLDRLLSGRGAKVVDAEAAA